MFFSAAKLFAFLFMPSHVLMWLLLGVILCAFAGCRRIARNLALAAAFLFLVIAVVPVWTWPIRSLEDQYPRASWPAHVDGVVVLGRGLDTSLLRARGVPTLERAAPRLIGGFEVMRRYPGARLVFTGGDATNDPALAEAVAARYILGQMGADPSRLILEDRARDTYENLVFSRRLVHPKPGEVWLLATSAWHMPRAMAVADRIGWKMLPWPTEYLTHPQGLHDFLRIGHNIDQSDVAFHEWLGLLAYRLRS
jgi:uncharacterized SAM-binding protein YcdF (DUF218 family)